MDERDSKPVPQVRALRHHRDEIAGLYQERQIS